MSVLRTEQPGSWAAVTAGALALRTGLGRTSQPATSRPRLRVVEKVGARPTRAPFVALVVALIVGGLLGLLMLNTALAQGAFTVQNLERESAVLTEHGQALAQQVAIESSPQRLAERAIAVGMVPSSSPAFIRAADGTVLGVPTPAEAPVEPLAQYVPSLGEAPTGEFSTDVPGTGAPADAEPADAEPAGAAPGHGEETAVGSGTPDTAPTEDPE